MRIRYGYLRTLTAAACVAVACACGASGVSQAGPSPTVSSAAAVSSSSPATTPSAAPSGTPLESPVPQQALAPATDLPVTNLCSVPLQTTYDGNAHPLFCVSGAVNVKAWQAYAVISASILGLGQNPMPGQAQSAMCDDLAHNGAFPSQEASAYQLAHAYYGWTFNVTPPPQRCP